MKKGVKWKVLLLSLIIVYSVAFIGALFTSGNVDTEWYESIKVSITPPNWIFPIIWNVLFFLIALSLYFAWTNAEKKQKRGVAIVFGINFALNIFWSVLFFNLRNPVLAFHELLFLLWPSILAMIIITKRINKLSSFLLIPYFLWVSFAGVLNCLIIFKISGGL